MSDKWKEKARDLVDMMDECAAGPDCQGLDRDGTGPCPECVKDFKVFLTALRTAYQEGARDMRERALCGPEPMRASVHDQDAYPCGYDACLEDYGNMLRALPIGGE